MLFLLAAIFGRKPDGPHDAGYYQRLIAEHVSFIEDRCYKAYGLTAKYHTYEDAPGANRADALLVEVMDHLKADDYRVLREYKGRSSIKRYLEVVISNKVIDLYRSKEGRSRAAEEARKHGEIGVRLYDMVFNNGLPVVEAHRLLTETAGYDGDVGTLELIVERIGSRRTQGHYEVSTGAYESGPEEGHARPRLVKDDAGELTVPDDAPDPEHAMIDEEKKSAKNDALMEIARMLSPEERLMVKLRYNDGLKVKEIAASLGITEKNAYRKYDLMLARCREKLLAKGLSLDDML